MLELLTEREEGILDRLRTDAIGEMQQWAELRVVPLDESPSGSSCSIAGIYLAQERPPVIGIWRNVVKPRAAFTALHELGHHIQLNDPELADELGDQPDLGTVLEEKSCDAFAARILLPGDLVEECLGKGTPTTSALATLWNRANASRAAVCVAAAQQLGGPGHVVLLDDAGIVQFASSYGEAPLRWGSDQSGSAIFKAFAARSFETVSVRETRFAYRDNIQGSPLYAQATSLGSCAVVVAVSDGAPWERMSLPSTGPTLKGRWWTCLNCEHIFQAWDSPCPKCNAPYCPECGKCECPSGVQVLTCQTCWLIKPAHEFKEDGITCNDH